MPATRIYYIDFAFHQYRCQLSIFDSLLFSLGLREDQVFVSLLAFSNVIKSCGLNKFMQDLVMLIELLKVISYYEN